MALRPPIPYIDRPSAALIPSLISVLSQTTADGLATGLTLVDAALVGQPSYEGCVVVIVDGGAAGQARGAVTHIAGTPTVVVDHPFTNAAGAVQQILAGTRYVIVPFPGTMLTGPVAVLNMLTRPRVSLYEGWQDELGIDFTVWTPTNPGAGVPWDRGPIGNLLMAYATINANNNARLRSNQRWTASPGLYAPNYILRRMLVEFEFHAVGFLNFDNANFFMGLTAGIADNRTSLNLIGWGLIGAGNTLQSVTVAGGAPTVATGFGENLLLTNKLLMDIQLNSVRFYVNEVEVANHIVNLPDAPWYLNFYLPVGAGGPATPRFGTIRIWNEDMVRP